MSTLFLINPASGRRRHARATQALIYEQYAAAGQQVEVQMIDFGRLDQALGEAQTRGIKNIYAVGGDGTVNAVGTRLVGKPINFGVIPNGSGNGYARNLGFSIKTKLAIRQSLDAESISVDSGVFNNIPFLNVAGIGLEAEIAHIFAAGKSRGFGPYVRSSATGLLGYSPQDYEIEIDGKLHHFGNIMGIAIANGTQWGYDAKISPRASITDGFLDLIVLRKFPLIKVAALLRRMFDGRLEKSRYVELFRGKAFQIRRAEAGLAQIDGEPIEAGSEIAVNICEKALNVLLPNTLTEAKIQSL